jgi:hypothetical protein
VFWCHPRAWTSHSTTSYFSLFTSRIKDTFYTVFVTRCLYRMSPQTPFTHIHHTVKGKDILSISAIFYKYMCFHNSPIYLVEKPSLVPVPEGLLYRKTNRYKRFGTKGPPSFVLVSYKPVLKGLHVGSQGVQG